MKPGHNGLFIGTHEISMRAKRSNPTKSSRAERRDLIAASAFGLLAMTGIVLVGVRRWNGSFAASPSASVGATRLGANFRPLPPEDPGLGY